MDVNAKIEDSETPRKIRFYRATTSKTGNGENFNKHASV